MYVTCEERLGHMSVASECDSEQNFVFVVDDNVALNALLKHSSMCVANNYESS